MYTQTQTQEHTHTHTNTHAHTHTRTHAHTHTRTHAHTHTNWFQVMAERPCVVNDSAAINKRCPLTFLFTQHVCKQSENSPSLLRDSPVIHKTSTAQEHLGKHLGLRQHRCRPQRQWPVLKRRTRRPPTTDVNVCLKDGNYCCSCGGCWKRLNFTRFLAHNGK